MISYLVKSADLADLSLLLFGAVVRGGAWVAVGDGSRPIWLVDGW